MRTSGHGNDLLMVLFPVAVVLGGGFLYFGHGELLRTVDEFLGTIARSVVREVASWF